MSLALCASASAQSGIAISDGHTASIEVNEKTCLLRDKHTDDEQWLHLRVTHPASGGADSSNPLEFRLGITYGKPLEVLKIAIEGEPAYGPVALYDRLEAELMANMDSWSPEQIADQDDRISAADGQPNEELKAIAITVEGVPAAEYFDNVRQAERFPSPRITSVSMRAVDLTVASDDKIRAATIELDGNCMTQVLLK